MNIGVAAKAIKEIVGCAKAHRRREGSVLCYATRLAKRHRRRRGAGSDPLRLPDHGRVERDQGWALGGEPCRRMGNLPIIPAPTMERRKRPGLGIGGQAVLDRIPPAIGNRRLQIIVVANPVFPEPPLPDAAFAFLDLASAAQRIGQQAIGKPRFDPTPPFGKVCITFGKGPDRVQVVRQNHHCLAGDGQFAHGPCIGKAKQIDMIGQRGSRPILKADREEICATRHTKATVICHAAILPQTG